MYGSQKEVPLKIQNPPKVAVVRLPTSEEMVARLDGQRSIVRSLGRGNTQTEAVANPDADLELFQKIRLRGDDFDAFEARLAISRLVQADATDCVREGGQYVITVATPFGNVSHRMRIPLAKDLYSYRKGIVSARSINRGRQDEIRYQSAAAVVLYDACQASASGYAPDTEVPAHHKFVVAAELVAAMDDLDPVQDPNSSDPKSVVEIQL